MATKLAFTVTVTDDHGTSHTWTQEVVNSWTDYRKPLERGRVQQWITALNHACDEAMTLADPDQERREVPF